MNLRAIGSVLTLLMLSACDRASPGSNSGLVPVDAVQRPPTAAAVEETATIVEPHRYLRLSDLALALRKAGYSCEAVQTYRQLQQNGRPGSAYKVDCLEYSYKLTIINGRSGIERWTAPAMH
jgi:hypothetical protein